ncbi:hypothetical protein DPMN_183123 [Dreissena polymorpha]|uniref:Uncharacterized protein n=1 Tax=Dreissena polymorpha TaxID=45954 RepID=A0A9D4I581_DREPO|nr:hypothetical protein DPMN_183123 [Dreissena polymorpha]
MQEKQANTTLRYKPGQSSSRESLVTALHSIPRARFPWKAENYNGRGMDRGDNPKKGLGASVHYTARESGEDNQEETPKDNVCVGSILKIR